MNQIFSQMFLLGKEPVKGLFLGNKRKSHQSGISPAWDRKLRGQKSMFGEAEYRAPPCGNTSDLEGQPQPTLHSPSRLLNTDYSNSKIVQNIFFSHHQITEFSLSPKDLCSHDRMSRSKKKAPNLWSDQWWCGFLWDQKYAGIKEARLGGLL